ncbi:MAG: type II toxin-antitoxin system death-on-curing family toxin [Planctomycetes bacterium]|nr:type II toxin-antitoxin system death-on-curing family toxin [Planctomycetota bacterium]
MSREPEWVTVEDALLYHGELIRAFGGSDGLREPGLLQSALGRARNVYAYESQDLVVLAGVYAHGLAKNHPFVDGNKRVAFVVTRMFLGLNGVAFDPPEAEAVVMVEGLAAGRITLAEFTQWVRKHAR